LSSYLPPLVGQVRPRSQAQI